MSFTVGLDIGQRSDPTALTVIKGVQDEDFTRSYHLRHADRFELGTPYPEVADKVAALMEMDELKKAKLVVDATGVGRPIVEMLEERGLRPESIWITGGDSVTKDRKGREYRVPKRELASTVQALLQSGRLEFAAELPFREKLTEELQKFRAKINVATGKATFEHWRERDTDDLVLALACALWHAENAPRGGVIVFAEGGGGLHDGLSDNIPAGTDKASRWAREIEKRLNAGR